MFLSLDTAVFRFINDTLSNPLFGNAESHGVMPFLAWNGLFLPAVIILAIALLWKGGTKGRLFVPLMLVVIAIGDGVICNTLKDTFARERPFMNLEDVNLLVGKGGSGSMPSAHSANWFSAFGLCFFFDRRVALRIVLPIACLIAFSRVYLGVHYPSDVMMGALLGIGYSTAILFGLDAVWRWAGVKWFPIWWRKLPSFNPDRWRFEKRERKPVVEPVVVEAQWRRLGYVMIVAVMALRWLYLSADKIELSEDEAYQWTWAQHPALSYYSKPPFIAYTQWLGTSIWGDSAFGVRFFSPLIAGLLSLVLFRFIAREVNLRAAFALILSVLAAPLLSVGSILMTIDPLNVLFWVLTMVAGWQAMESRSLKLWCWMGLWMGCGFLSKYTLPFSLGSWVIFFALWKPARIHLKTPGPWIAVVISLLCTIPVLAWNAQNEWITFTHLQERGGLHNEWTFRPNFIWDFLLAEWGLLNPVFFLAAVWACWVTIRRHRQNHFRMFLWCMGVPLFLFYFAYTIRSRVQPNWIAPAVVPMFMLMVIHFEEQLRNGAGKVRKWFWAGFLLGLIPTVLLHDTNLVAKISGSYLPAKVDPLRRVRGWAPAVLAVEAKRQELEEQTGTETFLIGGHYGVTGLMSFYIPEARDTASGDEPLVYFQHTGHLDNQFSFWPTYTNRVGQNAIWMRRTKSPMTAPQIMLDQFEEVIDLGISTNYYRGRAFHLIQMFDCRGLKAPSDWGQETGEKDVK